MKNHFISAYTGNKREEVEVIYENIKEYLNDKKIIIEPFCGTSAISCYISLQEPKKYKYILNDMDKNLIELYNIMKDENKLKKFVDEINKLCFVENKFIDKETYSNFVKKGDLYGWFIGNKYYSFRQKNYPLDDKRKNPLDYDKINQTPIINFLRTEDVEMLNKPAVDIMEQYKNNDDVFLICDPPYMRTCNSFYDGKNSQNVNIYEYMYDNHILHKKNMSFILEYIWIVKLLFKGYKKIEYEKIYNSYKKKKVKHVIFIND